MTEKLKPCPFCAGKNPRITTTTAYPDTPRETVWYAIECNICDATGDWDLGESGAIAKWNTRPVEDALRAENERLRGALRRILNESIDCEARDIAEQILAHGW